MYFLCWLDFVSFWNLIWYWTMLLSTLLVDDVNYLWLSFLIFWYLWMIIVCILCGFMATLETDLLKHMPSYSLLVLLQGYEQGFLCNPGSIFQGNDHWSLDFTWSFSRCSEYQPSYLLCCHLHVNHAKVPSSLSQMVIYGYTN